MGARKLLAYDFFRELTHVCGSVTAGAGGNLAQHAIGKFQFAVLGYFVEPAGVSGTTFTAADTVVELVGVRTFAAGSVNSYCRSCLNLR